MRSLSWRTVLLVVAVVFLIIALIAWAITIVGWLTTDNPKFEPLNVLISAITPSLISAVTFLASRRASPEPIADAPADLQKRNRQQLLNKVRIFWVEGVLEKSLHAEARLQLGGAAGRG